MATVVSKPEIEKPFTMEHLLQRKYYQIYILQFTTLVG